MGRRQVEIYIQSFNFNSSSACSRAVGRQRDLLEPEQVEELEPKEIQHSNGFDSHSPGGAAKSSSPSQLR